MSHHLKQAAVAVLLSLTALMACANPEPDSQLTTQADPAPATTTTTIDPGPTEAQIEQFAKTVSEYQWYTEVSKQQWYGAIVAQEAAKAEAAAKAKVAAAAKKKTHAAEASYGSGACGGSLPPCSVMRCESGGNIRAENPTSTASGKWQIIDGTWAGYGGYSHASHAPEHVQDERAGQIYANGAGRSHWVC